MQLAVVVNERSAKKPSVDDWGSGSRVFKYLNADISAPLSKRCKQIVLADCVRGPGSQWALDACVMVRKSHVGDLVGAKFYLKNLQIVERFIIEKPRPVRATSIGRSLFYECNRVTSNCN